MGYDDKAPKSGAEPEPLDRSVSTSAGEVDLSQSHQLQRGLKSRHIQFLALGGA